MSRPRAESWSTADDETGEEDGDIDPYVLGENNVLGMTADEQRSLLHSLSSSLADSVRMSGFESSTKSKWIGENWRLPGPLGNDIKVTNVPSVRLAYRYEALLSELQLLLTRSRL